MLLNAMFTRAVSCGRATPQLLAIAWAALLLPQGLTAQTFKPMQVRESVGVADTIREDRILPLPGERIAVVNSSHTMLRLVDSLGHVTRDVPLVDSLGRRLSQVLGAGFARDTIVLGFGTGPSAPTIFLLLDAAGNRRGMASIPPADGGSQLSGVLPTATGWFVQQTTYRENSENLPRPLYGLIPIDFQRYSLGKPTVVKQSPTILYRVPHYLYPIESMRMLIASQAFGGLVIADSPEYLLSLYSTSGSAREVRHQVAPVPVTARYRTEAIRALGTDTTMRRAKQVLDSLPLPKARSVIAKLWTAPDGRIAVLRNDLSALPWAAPVPHTVDILTRDGSPVGQVRIPAHHTIRAFTGNALITSWPDTGAVYRERQKATPAYKPPNRISRFRILP